MKFGFIGAGNVAQTYAKHFVRHGHEVVLSNSKGPDSLAELVRGIGAKAKAGTVQEAAEQEIVILAVRWEQAKLALAEISDWSGRILVDATNRPLEAETEGKTGSEIIASYAPGARLVKALNTVVVAWLQDVSDKKPKTVLFLSGDDADAKRKLASALEECGFVPVDIGGLIDGGKLQQFGAPLNALHLDLLKRLEFAKGNGEISTSPLANVQIVKEFFAAMGRGDKRGLLALSAEDIEWIIPGDDWALAGTHRGHAGLADLLQKASEMGDISYPTPPEFVAQGDRVLVVGFATGKIKATNKTFEDNWVFAITVRNGKLTNIREYIDTQALARASEMDAIRGPVSGEADKKSA